MALFTKKKRRGTENKTMRVVPSSPFILPVGSLNVQHGNCLGRSSLVNICLAKAIMYTFFFFIIIPFLGITLNIRNKSKLGDTADMAYYIPEILS